MSAREPQPPLAVSIPDPDLPWLEAFLEQHPEERERIEEAQRRDREMRDFAEAVIRDIYSHYTTGAPSRWGLQVTLHAFDRVLREEAAEIRLREAGDLAALVDELDEARARLKEDPRRRDLKRLAPRLLDAADELLGELDDTRVALAAAERIGRHDAQRARADALREAAELVRGGRGADELAQLAADAEPASPTPLDDLATEFGIELDPPAPEETE